MKNEPSLLSEAELLKLSSYYSSILLATGEDINREGLEKTPTRAAKAMAFMMQGYKQDARAVLASALFEEPYSEMVIVKDIELYSMCEHHMLPFFGKAHIAYIPNGKIVGLSKMARIVDIYARRLQVQERLTMEILSCIEDILHPLGAGVVIEAQHMCMMMRGVEKQNSTTTTSAFFGEFKNASTRSEFLTLIAKNMN